MSVVRLAMAQVNCVVGDLDGNAARIVRYIEQARAGGAHIVAFPELAMTGYPPEDLLLKDHFVHDNMAALQPVIDASAGMMVVVGFAADIGDGAIANAAAIIYDGRFIDIYRKVHLPNYGVFDEVRYFTSGYRAKVYDLGGLRVGVCICEDVWEPHGPAYAEAVQGGAEVVIAINASPYHTGKWREREDMLIERARETGAFMVYENMVGGQDELVFDGQAMAVDPSGKIIARGKQFAEDMVLFDIDTALAAKARKRKARAVAEESVAEPLELAEMELTAEPPPAPANKLAAHIYKPLDMPAEVYGALTLGVRDYVFKNEFSNVVIGVSGGIDSALTLAVAADALGPENVTALYMPSRFSAPESEEDARAVAGNLGVEFQVIPIDGLYETYLEALGPVFAGTPFGVAEENIQARIRGNLLMAVANKFSWLVLATGNKSELAVGYSTLYGDMAGGFEVIKDVPKTLVYTLAAYRNGIASVIPKHVITRAPAAELRPDQKDTDTLPPYDVLDPIVHKYVEEDKSPEEIIAAGFDKATVRRVVAMIDRNEYKRRQAPPGIKITPKAFGKDRRLPITNRYEN